jgi:hypothetical protein
MRKLPICMKCTVVVIAELNWITQQQNIIKLSVKYHMQTKNFKNGNDEKYRG